MTAGVMQEPVSVPEFHLGRTNEAFLCMSVTASRRVRFPAVWVEGTT